MSQPEISVILSPQAESDFADILQYTFQTWGEAQASTYRAVLDKALLTIGQHPQIGHSCPHLSPAHRIFPAGRHIIVYRVGEGAVNVSRILHERMDIARRI